MRKLITRQHYAILVGTILLAAMAQLSTMNTARAAVPAGVGFAPTAMAHWDVIDTAHGNVTIRIDAFYARQDWDATGKNDMIYVRVTHVPQGSSESISYTANFTSGPIWSMDRVYLNATLVVNWTTGPMSHPLSIEWLTSPQTAMINKYNAQNGNTVNANGAWRSGSGNFANATIVIGGAGPHGTAKYNSTWALVGVSSILPITSLSASALSDVTVKTGQTWNLLVQSSGGIGQHTYQWYEGTTLLSGQTSQLLPVNKSTTGTYTYSCKVTDSIGNTASSNIVTLTVS